MRNASSGAIVMAEVSAIPMTGDASMLNAIEASVGFVDQEIELPYVLTLIRADCQRAAEAGVRDTSRSSSCRMLQVRSLCLRTRAPIVSPCPSCLALSASAEATEYRSSFAYRLDVHIPNVGAILREAYKNQVVDRVVETPAPADSLGQMSRVAPTFAT